MEKKMCFTCLPFWKYTLLLFVVQLPSRAQLFVTPWTAACQASMSFTVSQSLLKLTSIESMMPSNHLIPFSSCLQSSLVSGSSPMSQFASGSQSIGASASASIIPMNIQSQSPSCPRDSQKFSPASQFESISSLVLSLLYGPSLTSVHDYWKKHSFDYEALYWERDVSAF